VVQGRAYTQEQRGDEELVTCYDLFTGHLLWEHADKTCFTQWQSGGGPHATPTVDAGRVYAYGGTGLLSCLDAATGALVWQHSVLTENKLANLEWGISASPLLVDEKVIVTGGETSGPMLFAFQRDTGAPLWQSGDDKASYSSPVAASLAGQRVILSSNARSLTAYDPKAGTLLLDIPWGSDKRPKASQPIVIGEDRVFVSAGYGYGCHLYQVKAEADGKLSGTELWRGPRRATGTPTASTMAAWPASISPREIACGRKAISAPANRCSWMISSSFRTRAAWCISRLRSRRATRTWARSRR
jgi:outer membrane protein assembly factor BamB